MNKHDSKTADEYYEGKGCNCFARNQDECACDVDWTPKEIIELRKKNAELEKVFANVLPVVAFLAREGVIQTDRGLKVEFDEWLAIRDLEQQAKGITDLKAMWEKAKSYKFEIEDLQTRADYLLEQAKQLKGKR